MSFWFVGIVSGLFGLLGVILASRALDVGMEVFGFALFGFGVLMVFWLLKHGMDAAEAKHDAALPDPRTHR